MGTLAAEADDLLHCIEDCADLDDSKSNKPNSGDDDACAETCTAASTTRSYTPEDINCLGKCISDAKDEYEDEFKKEEKDFEKDCEDECKDEDPEEIDDCEKECSSLDKDAESSAEDEAEKKAEKDLKKCVPKCDNPSFIKAVKAAVKK